MRRRNSSTSSLALRLRPARDAQCPTCGGALSSMYDDSEDSPYDFLYFCDVCVQTYSPAEIAHLDAPEEVQL